MHTLKTWEQSIKHLISTPNLSRSSKPRKVRKQGKLSVTLWRAQGVVPYPGTEKGYQAKTKEI